MAFIHLFVYLFVYLSVLSTVTAKTEFSVVFIYLFSQKAPFPIHVIEVIPIEGNIYASL